MRLGVLDVGSNTVRLEIADADGAAPLPLHTVKYPLRLADDVAEDGRLPGDAVARLVEAAAAARDEARRWGVRRLMAFATAIVRHAPNREQVLRAVREEAGIDLKVMSGDREAELTFLAARRWMGWRAGSLVLIDIGGGSAEVAFGRAGLPDFAVSLPLGARHLTREHFGAADPPAREAVKALRRQVRHQLRDVAVRIRWEEPHTAVATSRTFQQLARLCGAAPGRKGPFVPRWLDRGRLGRQIGTLAELPAAERARLPGVSPARAGQILAGAVTAHAAMGLLGLEQLLICPWALREGVLLEHLEGSEPALAGDPEGGVPHERRADGSPARATAVRGEHVGDDARAYERVHP
ncbi:Ppx/GppA family phosphatase [Streptomyces diacarni]|uniref:Ppx/GppA phosphatase family protein n=1 Tax=Streptomyces diacarni TaxID=2800381 RepID=UPI0033CC86F9